MSIEVKRYAFKGAAGYYVYSKDFDDAQELITHLQAKIKCMHRELYALAPDGYTNPDEIQGSTSN